MTAPIYLSFVTDAQIGFYVTLCMLDEILTLFLCKEFPCLPRHQTSGLSMNLFGILQ